MSGGMPDHCRKRQERIDSSTEAASYVQGAIIDVDGGQTRTL
jgi:hypothetical protein